jgi:ATP-dependent RNA helicase MSS116
MSWAEPGQAPVRSFFVVLYNCIFLSFPHFNSLFLFCQSNQGKTLAFLLPALERILQDPTPNRNQVGVLVISPTRELASQIGDQAEKLLTFHPDLSVQVVFGGTKISRDVNLFKKRLPSILVATPGRLLDHLESTVVKGERFGREIMSQTSVVVLDETDRLLDMGFRREIRKILSFLPRGNNRQTLLFSATIPKELKSIMAENMKPDFIEVDCINDSEDDSHTSSDIQQSHVIVPSMDRYVSSVVEIVGLAMKQDAQAKIVVFFPTARQVAFFAEFFNELLNIPVIELHSKKSQSYRNRASEQFRAASSGILFTSDVSARGVDYPGVSQVIQFGMPDTREQYIHRLGRTGRAGKTGIGWLILGPFESLFLQELKGLTVPRNDELMELLTDSIDADTDDIVKSATTRIRDSKKRQSSAKGAYQAFLGFYLGKMKRIKMRNKDELVSVANEFSFEMGLPEVPTLSKNLVGKMGLKGVRGVSLETSNNDMRNDKRRQRRAGGGGGPSNRKHHANGNRRPRY